jgi:hypothetical protein
MSRASAAGILAVALASASASARPEANRWFGNVEYVVAERVGREPVTYVANIFKYYVAYQRVAQAEQEREAALQKFESPKR